MSKVFAFDVGKASLGICVRDEATILELKSLLIPADFASKQDLRTRRRAYRTRISHKAREQWLDYLWSEAGLQPHNNHKILTKEFGKRSDPTIYNSILLRIALLQGQTLQEWQIYKALRASIQKRGYDKDNDWKTKESNDSEDNKKNTDGLNNYEEKLKEKISNPNYHYPCYLEASLLKLWNESNPSILEKQIKDLNSIEPVHKEAFVAPRKLVIQELSVLWDNACKQLPALSKFDREYFLFGEGRQEYSAIRSKEQKLKITRGKEFQYDKSNDKFKFLNFGVLSQKTPRFDNRMMNKCRLLNKRNTCNASSPENVKFNLLMKLKNFRFTDSNGERRGLTAYELQQIFEAIITKKKEDLEEKDKSKRSQAVNLGTKLLTPIFKSALKEYNNPNMPLGSSKDNGWKLSRSGRSRFCRPALRIMIDILLSGQNPRDFDISPYVEYSNNNPLTEVELKSILPRLGDSWENFSPQDDRYSYLTLDEIAREKLIIQELGAITNPIVRNRLEILLTEFKALIKEHGKPEQIILEFVRGDESLASSKASAEYEKMLRENEKKNDKLRNDLMTAGLKTNKTNLMKLKLLNQQNGLCPYSGTKGYDSLSDSDNQQNRLCPYSGATLNVSDLDLYEVDHIVPLSGDIATDALNNKVLVRAIENQKKKNRTPYEWLGPESPEYDPNRWKEFQERVFKTMKGLNSIKRNLLISPNARELIDSYNGLAETAYIARLAQKLIAIYLGWGLQTKDDERRIYTCSGKETAEIRRIYELNNLLLSNQELEATDFKEKQKKKRANKKHHALDAYALSFSQDLKLKSSDDTTYRSWGKYYSPLLEDSLNEFKSKFQDLMPLTIRRNSCDLFPDETIYSLRSRVNPQTGKEEFAITKAKPLIDNKNKPVDFQKIWDEAIREDLMKLQTILSEEELINKLKSYKHPIRQTIVKKVHVIESKNQNLHYKDQQKIYFEYADFSKGFQQGQFKRSKTYKGYMIYKDGKSYKRHAINIFDSVDEARQKLISQGYSLYADGQMFYSGCLIYIENEFEARKKQIIKPGLYTLTTIIGDGETCKIKDSNNISIETTLNTLAQAGFHLIETN